MFDPMTSLAFSAYSSKGVYALLLGSGISRTSGIPTGWEITLELIRKATALEGKDCGGDPEQWFIEMHGKDPDYSELLEAVAKTSAERMRLLKGFFEPNEEERESGKKVPTPAHHAIARLVADGYIRVIVTTNFDRLMERALEAVGVVPSVISTTDAIEGATPLVHSNCTVLKVHGDYLDTRLRNTSSEVGQYTDPMNKLLDQVFDEYGLIVSGWSAEWDAALRAAIERSPNRRYTTYWSSYGELTDAAKALCEKRDAQVIRGKGADEFFTGLAEKVSALKEMDAPHPLTAKMAVATLKKYLVDDKDRIRLHDLMMNETNRVAEAVLSSQDIRDHERNLGYYESKMQILLPMLIMGGYWGRAAHRRLWLNCFRQLVTPKGGWLQGLAIPMDNYPAYLALYAFGMASLAGGRPRNFGYVLARGKAKSEGGRECSLIFRLIETLGNSRLDNEAIKVDPQLRQFGAQGSRYLFNRLRELLRELIPEDDRYMKLFHRFEYMLSLALAEQLKIENDFIVALGGVYMANSMLPEEIGAEIERQKENWPLLKCGLFEGSYAKLKEIKDGFDTSFRSQRMRQGYHR